MAQIVKNPSKSEWINLGRIRPIHSWQSYESFTNHFGTFRLLAFSFSDTYERFCHLRIRYDFGLGISPLYSRWSRYYPSSEFRLWNPQLDPNFLETTKTIEVIDYLKYPYYSSPVVPLSWNLSIDFLTE